MIRWVGSYSGDNRALTLVETIIFAFPGFIAGFACEHGQAGTAGLTIRLMNADSTIFTIVWVLGAGVQLASVSFEAFVAATIYKVAVYGPVSEALSSVEAVIVAHVNLTVFANESFGTYTDGAVVSITLASVKTDRLITILTDAVLTRKTCEAFRAFAEWL